MDDIEYSQAIARIRRAQPNNAALQELLDEAQRRLVADRAQSWPKDTTTTAKPKDRKVYMRELMRKRRAVARGKKQP